MKSIILAFFVIAIQGIACNNKQNSMNNELTMNNISLSISYQNKQLVSYATRGRFCIILLGKDSDKNISEALELFNKSINQSNTDFYFIDISKATDEEIYQYRIDFPSMKGIYAISASGNLIKKTDDLSNESILKILERIKELMRLFEINGIELSDFNNFKKPVLKDTTRKNFFLAGTYNNIVVPQDFCEKGKTSVFVFCTPKCPPCDTLKKYLYLDKTINPEKTNFYFVNVAYDDRQNKYPWSEIKTTKAMKIYAMEGMAYFPTVWIVSPTGSTSDALDGNKIEGLTLFEFICKRVAQYDSLSKGLNISTSEDKKDIITQKKKEGKSVIEPKKEENYGKTVKEESPKQKTEFISINKIEIAKGTLQIYYNNEGTSADHIIEIIIEDNKGKLKTIHYNENISSTRFDNGSKKTQLNYVFDLKKKTKYLLSLNILVGNNRVFKIAKKEFSTDKYVSASIIL